MDPLSQGVVGAVLAMSAARRRRIRRAAFCGVMGGWAPDFDVLIRSAQDPLLSLEYHRHFTHSIFMAPIMGLLVAVLLWLCFNRVRTDFKDYYIFSTLGVVTHGLLDTTTSYGTYLLWPFSDVRLTWHNMSIIDPIFTLTLLVFVILSFVYMSRRMSLVALGFGALYLSFATINMWRVQGVVRAHAIEQGHNIERLFLNPTLGNAVYWRTLYESESVYYVNAVLAKPFKTPEISIGTQVNKIDIARIYPEILPDSQQRKDMLRFDKFAMGYLYEYEPYLLADLRYGLPADSANPLWGIKIDIKQPENHVQRFSNRIDRAQAFTDLRDKLFGK